MISTEHLAIAADSIRERVNHHDTFGLALDHPWRVALKAIKDELQERRSEPHDYTNSEDERISIEECTDPAMCGQPLFIIHDGAAVETAVLLDGGTRSWLRTQLDRLERLAAEQSFRR